MGTKRVGWARIRSLINENGNQLAIPRVLQQSSSQIHTLTADDSGKSFYLADKFAITLPAAAAGLEFNFVLKEDIAHTSHGNIDCAGSDEFVGSIAATVVASHSKPHYADASTNYTKIQAGQNKAKAGDWITLEAIGAGFWYVRAHSSGSNGVYFVT